MKPVYNIQETYILHSKDSIILNTKRIKFYKVLQATSEAFCPQQNFRSKSDANQRNQKSLTARMK